jgi:ACS family glucarate transporter-like MFS transporter
MKDFGFDKIQLGITMSAFFLAYTLMQIPGGLMSERYGLRFTGAVAMAGWSVFTFLTPLAWGFYSFLIIRFLFGAGEGPLFPNNGSFLAKWFSKEEKALSSSIMVSGAFIGPALGPPLTVWIMTTWGWPAVFYFYGIAGIIMTFVWYVCSRDFPHQHPSVNQAEVMHITQKTAAEAEAASKHEQAPWKRFLLSTQFWCLGFQYCTVNYIMYVFLSWLPIYLLEARGLSLKAMGVAAAYPWIAICVALVTSGIISDRMVRSGMSKFMARTCIAIIGMVLCGIGLYKGANAVTASDNILWMSFSLGFLGFTYTAAWAACQDLGQKFGGSVVAWMNTWANIGGFFAPTITAILVQAFGWQTALSMTAVVIAIGAVCWIFVRPDKPLHVDKLLTAKQSISS